MQREKKVKIIPICFFLKHPRLLNKDRIWFDYISFLFRFTFKTPFKQFDNGQPIYFIVISSQNFLYVVQLSLKKDE